MLKNSRKTSKQPLQPISKSVSLLYLVVCVLVLLLVFSILLNIKYVRMINYISSNGLTNIPGMADFIDKAMMTTSKPSSCAFYPYNVPKSYYLDTYTVHKGDTLLSIARDRLGDPSRVTELINLNKNMYPNLSLEIPFLEVGWKLYLLPANLPATTGNISEAKGEIVSINSLHWDILLTNNHPNDLATNFDIPNVTFVNKPINKYHVGDCVNIIIDSGKYPIASIFTPQ